MQGKYTIWAKIRALHIPVRCTLYGIFTCSYKYSGALHLYLLHLKRSNKATEWRNICSLAKSGII
jgi:hypothetical protein